MINSTVVAVVTMLAILTVVVWFDARCLADLAHSSDHELRYVNRSAWASIIVISFPTGPLLSVRYAKGSSRFW